MKNKRFFPLGITVKIVSAIHVFFIIIYIGLIIYFIFEEGLSAYGITMIILFSVCAFIFFVFWLHVILRASIFRMKFDREYMQSSWGTQNKPNSKIKYRKEKIYYYDILEACVDNVKCNLFEKKVIEAMVNPDAVASIKVLRLKLHSEQMKILALNSYSKKQKLKILDEIKARVNSAGNKLNYSSKALVNELNDIKEEDYAPLE